MSARLSWRSRLDDEDDGQHVAKKLGVDLPAIIDQLKEMSASH